MKNNQMSKEHEFIPCKRSNDIHGEDNFTQGCKFSPDGSCILTCTAADHRFRLYNTVDGMGTSSLESSKIEWKSALDIQEGDAVRSYAWYPHMNSMDANSCIFLSSAR